MKRRKFPIILTSLASVLLLGSCAEYLPEIDETEEVTRHYLVSFYVDDTLYKTARVKEGETVGVTIEDPEKEGFTFEGWQTSDGVAFNLSTDVVTSALDLYANFKIESSGGDVSEEEASLVINETKDPTKTYTLVVGWYKKFLEDDVVRHFYYNLRLYLRDQGVSEDVINGISFRQYGDEDTNVAGIVELVNADGDVDLFFGGGGNLTDDKYFGDACRLSTGSYILNENENARRHAIFDENNEIALKVFNYLDTEEGFKLWDLEYTYDGSSEPVEPVKNPWDDVNVKETKDDTKSYTLVIGWWSRFVQENTMKHFYYNLRNYLIDQNYDESLINGITVREFSDEKIAGLVESVNAQSDIDLFFGGAANLKSNFGDSIVISPEENSYTIDGKDSRVNALFDSTNEFAKQVFDFVGTEEGIKFWDLEYLYETGSDVPSEPLVTEDNILESDLNVRETKEEGKDYYLVVMWHSASTSGLEDNVVKHFYHNLRAYLIDRGITQTQLDSITFRTFDGKVDPLAQEIASQGDVDLLFGAGGTIVGALKDANVELLEHSNGQSELGTEDGFVFGEKTKRNHCRLSDKEIAKEIYTYVCTSEGNKMWDLSYEYSAK